MPQLPMTDKYSLHTWYGSVATSTWDATDPRLSGEATYREMLHEYPGHGFDTFASEWTVRNDAGSWTGSGRGFSSDDIEAEWTELQGSGAYEGWTAYVHWDRAPGKCPASCLGTATGVIVAGGMPPYPEPLAD